MKYDASASYEQEVLFVFKQFMGSSTTSMYWYELSVDGTVTEYHEDPFNRKLSKKING